MKKDKVYTCFLVMTSFGSILKAHSKCPAGIDGRCNHSGAPKRSTIGIMGNQRKPMNSFSRGYHG